MGSEKKHQTKERVSGETVVTEGSIWMATEETEYLSLNQLFRVDSIETDGISAEVLGAVTPNGVSSGTEHATIPLETFNTEAISELSASESTTRFEIIQKIRNEEERNLSLIDTWIDREYKVVGVSFKTGIYATRHGIQRTIPFEPSQDTPQSYGVLTERFELRVREDEP